MGTLAHAATPHLPELVGVEGGRDAHRPSGQTHDRHAEHGRMSALDGIARAQGAMGALQSAVGGIVTAAAEAEDRAETAERRVRELERQLEREQREAYRRGYGTGHLAGRTGKAANPDKALRDPRCKLVAA